MLSEIYKKKTDKHYVDKHFIPNTKSAYEIYFDLVPFNEKKALYSVDSDFGYLGNFLYGLLYTQGKIFVDFCVEFA